MGHMIQTRAISYFLPLVLFFQALGLVRGLDWVCRRKVSGDSLLASNNMALAGILLIYCAVYSIGKHRAMDAAQGNPYMKARDYLVNNSSPNDLVISSLYDTLSGFYLGRLILEKNENIYNAGMIGSIYYLTADAKTTSIVLKDYGDSPKEVFPLSAFEEVARFENKGVRKETILIYRFKVHEKMGFRFDAEFLSRASYIGDNGPCQVGFSPKDGLKLTCREAWLACSEKGITLIPESLPGKHYQLAILSRFGNRGTRAKAFFGLATPNENGYLNLGMLNNYTLNPLVSNINDLDIYKENVRTWDTTIQLNSKYQNLYLCFSGRIFDGNSLIKGARVIDFTID
jgi:hypothetical protein